MKILFQDPNSTFPGTITVEEYRISAVQYSCKDIAVHVLGMKNWSDRAMATLCAACV